MYRIIWMFPTWILFIFLIALPMMIIGWIIIPIAGLSGAYKLARINNKDIYHFTWRFMFPWDNHEDGIANNTYIKFESMFMRIIYWSCLRNPINNLRITPYLSCKIKSEKVKFIGSLDDINKYDTQIPQWFLAWQGIYSNLFWQFNINNNLYRFWAGNAKIYPTDINGIKIESYRYLGAGWVLQLKKL